MQDFEVKQSIIRTLAYFDLCKYPLTYPELYRYLWRSPDTTLAEIIHTTRQLDQVVEQDGFVMFKDRTNLPRIRQQRYIESELKWNKRRWFIKLLSYLPGVEGIFLVNTLAYHNVQADSDIDLLIVSRPQAIWAVRFYTTLAAKLFNLRPKPDHTRDAVCLSFYVTPSGLKQLASVRQNDDDALEAYWLVQALPIYDPKNYRQQLVECKWLHTVLPKNQPVQPHHNRTIRHTWLHNVSHAIGRLFLWNTLGKRIQLWVMPKKLKELSGPLPQAIVILDDNLLKFHTRDPRAELLKEWADRYSRYGARNSVA